MNKKGSSVGVVVVLCVLLLLPRIESHWSGLTAAASGKAPVAMVMSDMVHNTQDASVYVGQKDANLYPAFPKAPLALPMGNSVDLSWNSIPNVTFYNIYRYTDPLAQSSAPYSTQLVVDQHYRPGAGVTFVDNNVDSGVTYYYSIEPVFATGPYDSHSLVAIATPLKPADNTLTFPSTNPFNSKNPFTDKLMAPRETN